MCVVYLFMYKYILIINKEEPRCGLLQSMNIHNDIYDICCEGKHCP